MGLHTIAFNSTNKISSYHHNLNIFIIYYHISGGVGTIYGSMAVGSVAVWQYSSGPALWTPLWTPMCLYVSVSVYICMDISVHVCVCVCVWFFVN